MGKLILTEEEKKNIRDMYSDVKPSKKIMSYLKRNFHFFKPIDEMKFNSKEEKQKRIEDLPFLANLVKIVIDDKSYILNNDKKNIKKRITYVIEDVVERIDPDANKAVVSKTIKDYLDGIMINFGSK